MARMRQAVGGVLQPAKPTSSEESAYLMPLERGSASVQQVTARLGFSPQRAARVVASLETKGPVHRTRCRASG